VTPWARESNDPRGCISVKNPDEEILRKMHQIASQLDARVLGDEGEEYDAHGEVLADPKDDDSSTHRKPWWKLWRRGGR